MANYKKIAGSKVSFTLKIEESDLKKAQKSVIAQSKANLSIKGFRKGHAPDDVVISQLGIEKMYYESLNKAIDKNYRNFIETEKLAVIAAPKVELGEGDKMPQEVKCEVEVFPGVELGDYKKLKIKKTKIAITEKEISDVLETLCAQMNFGTIVKRAAKKSDLIEADFGAFDEKGVAIPNTSGENQKFRLGMGHFLEDLEKAFEGMKAGEAKDKVKVKFPKTYHSKDFANKTINFKIKLHEVFEIDPEKLDEDTIEKLSGKKQSLADFKKQIKETITTNKKQESEKRDLAIYNKDLAKITKVDLPETWIANELKNRMERVKQNPQYKQDPSAFFKALGKTESEVEAEIKKEIDVDLKVFLALSEIVKTEKVELDKDELEQAHHMAHQHLGNDHSHEGSAHEAEMSKAVLNIKIDKYLKTLLD